MNPRGPAQQMTRSRGSAKAAALFLLIGVTCAFVRSASSAEDLGRIFRQVNDAVVVVRTTERAVIPGSRGRQVDMEGLGSGVLISADGKVLTAAHVVQTADVVLVEFPEHGIFEGEVIASEPAADVALLQLSRVPEGVKPARLADSDKVGIGDQVLVIGAPLGITHTLSVGHVSARRKPNVMFSGMLAAEYFQTDASINQGNSGGPMFNLDGQVIGIVSHIVSQSGGSVGLGFAATSNVARRLLLDQPTVWSGLHGFLLSGEMARVFNLPVGYDSGLLVQRVAQGSLADQLGVRGGRFTAAFGDEELLLGGDVILLVEGIGLGGPDAYERIRQRMIELRATGGSVHVTLLRGGELLELAAAVYD